MAIVPSEYIISLVSITTRTREKIIETWKNFHFFFTSHSSLISLIKRIVWNQFFVKRNDRFSASNQLWNKHSETSTYIRYYGRTNIYNNRIPIFFSTKNRRKISTKKGIIGSGIGCRINKILIEDRTYWKAVLAKSEGWNFFGDE